MKKRNKFFSDKDRKKLEQVHNPEFISDMEDILSNPHLKLPFSKQLESTFKYGTKLRIK